LWIATDGDGAPNGLCEAARTVTEQNRYRVVARICRDDVGLAVAVDRNSSGPAKVASQKSLRILGLDLDIAEKPGSVYV
jgi:hypothetical protein